MSLIGDALIGGIGSTLNDTSAMMDARIKSREAEEVQVRRDIRQDELAEKRAATAQALREEYDIRTETRKNEPLMRVSEQAKKYSTEQVPDIPAPVTELSGDDDGKVGMKGNYASLVQRAQNLPEEDRAPYLAQLERQLAQETKTGLINSSGKMRNRTTDEAMKAALDDAKINNPLGYAAYDKDIGRPARDERIAVGRERELTRKEAKDKEDARLKEASLETKEYIAELKADAKDAGKSKGEQSEKVMTYMNGRLRDLTNEAANVQKEMTGALKDAITPEEKAAVRKEYQPRLSALADERTQINADFKSMREKFGLPPMAEPERKPTSQAAPASRASQFKVIR